MDRGDDRFSRIAMAEMVDAVVVTDDLHIAKVALTAKRHQFAYRTWLQRVDVPLPQPGKCLAEQVQDDSEQVAEHQPGKKLD